jgi:hypothetical protein
VLNLVDEKVLNIGITLVVATDWETERYFCILRWLVSEREHSAVHCGRTDAGMKCHNCTTVMVSGS